MTISTYFAGSYWSDLKNRDSKPIVGETAITKHQDVRGKPLSDRQISELPRSGTLSKRKRRDHQIGAGRTEENPRLGGLRSRYSKIGQLTTEEIQSLIRESIKSANPLERRLAFDRVLQEIGSSEFTMELAMAARVTMAEDGASGDQWRLFDYAWGANHPDAAIAYLNEVPAQQNEAFLANMIPGLGSEHPQRAIELFSNLDSDLQARIRPRFLEGLIDNDTALATEYLYESTDRENYNWRPMDELARELVRNQGLESTLEWAADLPEGTLRGSAWSAAYAVWASQDPQAAVQSIIAMPRGADRNLAINGFVSAHAHQDGEMAVTWAAEIAEPSLRQDAMIRVGRQYFAQNPQAATEWFASSGLPDNAWSRVTNPDRER